MEELSSFSFLILGTQGLVLFKFKPMMLRFDRSQNGEKMWVKICNLNLIPKIGGSESRSCGRRDSFFWNFPLMSVCVSASPFTLLSGHYSLPRTFLLPREGNSPCLIHSAVCLFLANSCPLCIHQVNPSAAFSFQLFPTSFNSQAHVVFFSYASVPLRICNISLWVRYDFNGTKIL